MDCVIIGNSISDDKPFIYLENAYFTMINCLYFGNDIRNHVVLNSTTNVTIKNVTFFNNSLGGIDNPGNEKSLLIVNNTLIEIKNCRFENNHLQKGSLILMFESEVRVMNSVISHNYNTDWTDRKMISIHNSKAVEFSSSIFINNSCIDIFDIWSATFLLINRCSFENNDATVEFTIWDTYNVIFQRLSFYTPTYHGATSFVHDVNNLRIFGCTYTPFIGSFSTYGNMRTKLFRLDSQVTVQLSEGAKAIVINGSPYASGWY